MPPSAILLIGPTGSGKTPLGDLLERTGFLGRRCVHLDFGAILRSCATDSQTALTSDEHAVVRDALDKGRLLSDAEFPVAKKLVEAFLRRRLSGDSDVVVLNGLPRHKMQAVHLADTVDVRLVVHLRTPDDVVHRRIATDAGGDRGGRADDAAAKVAERLVIYRRETIPLLDHYRGNGVALVELDVYTDTRPGGLKEAMESVVGRALEE